MRSIDPYRSSAPSLKRGLNTRRMPPRRHITLAIVCILTFIGFSFLLTSAGSHHEDGESFEKGFSMPEKDVLMGEATAEKLGNETLKAELGRSSWLLLHTTMSKYPVAPTPSDKEALRSYIHLFARLYPCGDCARHFQGILKKFPPQVASRNAAATWACHVHNQVNARLGKEAFDCSKIGDFYDCGCGSEEGEGDKAKGKEGSTKVDGEKGEAVKEKPREVQKEAGGVVSEKTRKKDEHFTPLQLEKEGMTRGG